MPLAETANLVVNMNLRGDFRKGMAGAQKDLRGFTTQANTTTGRLGRLSARLKSPELRSGLLQGVGLSGGLIGFQLLGTAVSGAIDYMGDAIAAASELEESQAKVDQVFTDSAPTIRRWASSSAEAFGLSERAALEAAGTFGNFLQALGTTESASNDMSRAIVELSADLASFNNQNIDDVIIALRSGLAGESEPVRRLGIDISAARVETLLLARGIEKVNGEFTQAQKVQGRYLAIMEDTTKAQGDFERTSDGLANQTRIFNAQMADLSAEVGKALLPAMTELAHVATEELVPAIYEIGESIGPTLKLLGDLKGGIDDVVDAVPPEARDLFDDIFGGLGPVPNAIGGIQGSLQELQRATIGVNEDGEAAKRMFDSLTVAAVKANRSLNGTTYATEEVADAAENATEAIGGRGLGAAFESLTEAVGSDLTSAMAKFRKETYDARKALQSFRDSASEIAETRNIQKVNAALARQRRLRDEAAREGNVRAFAAAQARLEELKAERRLIREGRRALKAFQDRKKEERQAERATARQANAAQKDRRESINDTIAKLKELGNTRANPRVTIAGIAAAQSQLTTLRETLAALREEGGVTYDPVTGQVRRSAGRAAGGPVQKGRAYIVGEHRPEVFVPSENGRIVPNVPSGGGGVEVYVTPYLTVAASQVEGHTSKVIRTQRFREKN